METYDPFDVSTGVQQGDVLAPFLFVVYLLKKATSQLDSGVVTHPRYSRRQPAKSLNDLVVRRQAKSRVFLMIKVATKVIIVLQGRKYHSIFGGKISGRSNRIYDPRKVTYGSNF